MRFMKITGMIACATLTLGLAACTGGDTGNNAAAAQADNANELLICYSYSGDNEIGYDGSTRVFNSKGQLLAKTELNNYPNSNDYVWIVFDSDNRQTGIAKTTHYYSDTERDKWGSPLTDSINYSILDINGNEVSNVTIEKPGTVQMQAPNGATGDILYLNFVDREASADGVPYYELYDKSGACIMADKLISGIENEDTAYASIDYNGELLVIQYDAWNTDWSTHLHESNVYARRADTGEFAPKELDKEYQSVSMIYTDQGYSGNYWKGEYYPTTGTAMYDILRADGTVAIEGLNAVLSVGNGMIFARVGNERVLMDMEGKRLYSESIFNTLTD